MKYFRTVSKRLGKVGSADRQDHEFLNIDAVIGVRPAIDDVHHRNRHRRAVAQMPKKENSFRMCFGFGHRQRNGEQRIRTQVSLVVATVQINHLLIDGALIAE